MARITLILTVLTTVIAVLGGFKYLLNELRDLREHKRVTGRWLVVLLFILAAFTSQPAEAANTINAVSCNQTKANPHVSNAVKQAQNGDTVIIPSGACSWSWPVDSYCSASISSPTLFNGAFCNSGVDGDTKYITIQGAGIGQTILIDEVPKNNDPPNMIFWDTPLSAPGTIARITGVEIRGTGSYGGVNCQATSSGGMSNVLIYGRSNTFRWDHSKFIAESCPAIRIGRPNGQGYLRGVFDNNIYDISAPNTVATLNGFYVMHGSWGNVGTIGDNSWATPNTLGTADAIYIEDGYCINTNTGHRNDRFLLDGWEGTRVVVRHVNLRQCTIGYHGLDSVSRSGRHAEFYNNVFTGIDGVSPWNTGGVAVSALMSLRGGTGVIYNNTITVTNGSITRSFNASYFRDNGGPDNNTYYGLCTGTNPYDQNANPAGNGDGYRCIDQPGAGQGDLMHSEHAGGAYNMALGANVWPRQALDPIYVWNNTINGTVVGGDNDGGNVAVQLNRDLYNCLGVTTPTGCRPDYSPLTYPHPLAGGEEPPPPPPSFVPGQFYLRFAEVLVPMLGLAWHFRSALVRGAMATVVVISAAGSTIALAMTQNYQTMKQVSRQTIERLAVKYLEHSKKEDV